MRDGVYLARFLDKEGAEDFESVLVEAGSGGGVIHYRHSLDDPKSPWTHWLGPIDPPEPEEEPALPPKRAPRTKIPIDPTAPVYAGHRDASVLDCPGYASKYHVVVKHPRNGLVAACNNRIQVHHDDRTLAEFIEPELRCEKAGCRVRWPKFATRGK